MNKVLSVGGAKILQGVCLYYFEWENVAMQQESQQDRDKISAADSAEKKIFKYTFHVSEKYVNLFIFLSIW